MWAYCLMPNHDPLTLKPAPADDLGRALREVHRRYTNFINARGRCRRYCGEAARAQDCPKGAEPQTWGETDRRAAKTAGNRNYVPIFPNQWFWGINSDRGEFAAAGSLETTLRHIVDGPGIKDLMLTITLDEKIPDFPFGDANRTVNISDPMFGDGGATTTSASAMRSGVPTRGMDPNGLPGQGDPVVGSSPALSPEIPDQHRICCLRTAGESQPAVARPLEVENFL